MKKLDAVMVSKHFQQESHNVNKHAKFTIIDQLTNTSKSKETLTQWLIEREILSILKLDTLYPKGFKMGWDSVNSKYNNYNKRLYSCIRLSNIRFSPLQLGHYQAEKLPYQKKHLTSYLICNLHNFNNFL